MTMIKPDIDLKKEPAMGKKPSKTDFPLLQKTFDGKKLIYLDSAATTQKPNQVIDAISNFYKNSNANVGRSSHFLADIATDEYEDARKAVADFIGAQANGVIFTKNATESLNMVAFGWGMQNISENDIILTTVSEHNSSILPWQIVAKETGAKIEYLEVDENGILLSSWEKAFKNAEITEIGENERKVKAVVLAHVSNVLGVIAPIKDISTVAKKAGAITIVDGSQAVSHINVNVQTLGCDFYAFSGHKMLGPTGIGVLWGNQKVLKQMSPISFGGGMVNTSAIENFDLKEAPHCFESGTPNIAGAVGLRAAINYLNTIGIRSIEKHSSSLMEYALNKLKEIPNLKVLGTQNEQIRTGLVSFIVENIHSHDISAVLSSKGIAVRSGMQCSMNLYKMLKIKTSTRASFHIYNTKDDIDALVEGVKQAIEILA